MAYRQGSGKPSPFSTTASHVDRVPALDDAQLPANPVGLLVEPLRGGVGVG